MFKNKYHVSRSQYTCLCVSCSCLVYEGDFSVYFDEHPGRACIKCVNSHVDWKAPIQKPRANIVADMIAELVSVESHRMAQEDSEDTVL